MLLFFKKKLTNCERKQPLYSFHLPFQPTTDNGNTLLIKAFRQNNLNTLKLNYGNKYIKIIVYIFYMNLINYNLIVSRGIGENLSEY